ncbi:hypothetical protein FOLKNPGA_02871 [Legionella sp. PC1000]|nr:hypothetical protein FOLKNPGA_02871 [Legionella sp. PC1000]
MISAQATGYMKTYTRCKFFNNLIYTILVVSLALKEFLI